jgi:hypothetical protein
MRTWGHKELCAVNTLFLHSNFFAAHESPTRHALMRALSRFVLAPNGGGNFALRIKRTLDSHIEKFFERTVRRQHQKTSQAIPPLQNPRAFVTYVHLEKAIKFCDRREY